LIRAFEDKIPQVGENSYIDESAVIIGDVVIGRNCSVWPMTVIRGDVNLIRIGDNTNIQDGSVLHVSHQSEYNPLGAELHIGDQVTVGHKALLHGCKIGNQCLIGMGSIVADNAIIEDRVMLGSGSLVPPGKVLETGYLYLGNPVRQKRELSEREIESLVYLSDHYLLTKNRYRD
jgi:carbonic anhydrase/acetyltransferase-like protein (isoleucine patch superfamily)